MPEIARRVLAVLRQRGEMRLMHIAHELGVMDCQALNAMHHPMRAGLIRRVSRGCYVATPVPDMVFSPTAQLPA